MFNAETAEEMDYIRDFVRDICRDEITAQIKQLLAHLGLEAAQTQAQEAGWELRKCETD